MKTLQKPTCCKCGGTYINFECDVGWNEETRTLEVEDLWDYPHRCLDCDETVTIRWVPFDEPISESKIDAPDTLRRIIEKINAFDESFWAESASIDDGEIWEVFTAIHDAATKALEYPS